MPSLATLPRDLKLFAKYHLVRRWVTYPAREESLGIVPLPFDLDAYAAELVAFEGERFAVRTETTVRYREREHPILSVSSRKAAPRTLLVLAGVHGNEHAGMLAVPRILESFDTAGVRLVMVTPVNPVGAAELSRLNADGYDVNRDFLRFDTPEARLIRDIYARERPDFVVSLHEGPQDATFLFANRFVNEALARELLSALDRGGTRLADTDYFGMRLAPPGLSASSRTGRALVWLWEKTIGMKATLAYSEGLGIPEIVLESSWRLPNEVERVRAHVNLVNAVAHALGRAQRSSI